MSHNITDYILTLARSFPCLEPKLRHYHPAHFDGEEFFRMIGPWSRGERQAALFILTVWNPGAAEFRRCTFDLVEAASILDGPNLRPIIEWMTHPYYP